MATVTETPVLRTFRITIVFLAGPLRGLRHTDLRKLTDYRLRPGDVVRRPIGGSPYRVLAVECLSDR